MAWRAQNQSPALNRPGCAILKVAGVDGRGPSQGRDPWAISTGEATLFEAGIKRPVDALGVEVSF